MRYLLEGGVRKAGTHLWADKFDGALEDIFDLQDRVTASVAGAIAPTITRAEIERAGRKPPESLQAYDLLLRAMEEARTLTAGGIDRALSMVGRAVELDPRYGEAWSFIARWLAYRRTLGSVTDPQAEMAEGIKAAERSVE